MNQGQTLFAQVMAHAPHREFQRWVRRYKGDARVRRFTCWDHFLTLAFAQLTYRESLRDIECSRKCPSQKRFRQPPTLSKTVTFLTSCRSSSCNRTPLVLELLLFGWYAETGVQATPQGAALRRLDQNRTSALHPISAGVDSPQSNTCRSTLPLGPVLLPSVRRFCTILHQDAPFRCSPSAASQGQPSNGEKQMASLNIGICSTYAVP
jgi:hypothetical protein